MPAGSSDNHGDSQNRRDHIRNNLDGEILSGVLAGLAVSPLVAMVDKAVFSAASGKMSYNESFKECALMLLVSPTVFVRRTTFKWCFAVYASTFVTANCADRFARLNDLNVPRTTFLAASAVNVTLNIFKDSFMTRRYSMPDKYGTPLPNGTLWCFVIRDLITMIGAFACIEPVAEKIKKYVIFYSGAKLISQSICPILSQLINTPFFIYGVDLYNRPKATFLDRLRNVRKSYWDTYYWGRVARVGPAYSVGGVLNMILRFCFTQNIPTKKQLNGHDGIEKKEDEDSKAAEFNAEEYFEDIF